MSGAQGNRQLLRALPSRLPASQGGRGRATTRGGPGHLPPPQLLPCCSQTPQPFPGQDLSPGGADGSVPRHGCSPAAPGQMRGEVVGSGGLRASESCSAGARFRCARSVGRPLGSSEEKTGQSARQKHKSPFAPNPPGFPSVWMEDFGLQGRCPWCPGQATKAPGQ